MSSVADAQLGAVKLADVREGEHLGASLYGHSVSTGRDWLWAKTRAAFEHVYAHYYNDYDWFVKADDDTYMIVDNLRRMLTGYTPSKPIWFGCRLTPGSIEYNEAHKNWSSDG
jgi:hypothetical protein